MAKLDLRYIAGIILFTLALLMVVESLLPLFPYAFPVNLIIGFILMIISFFVLKRKPKL